MANLRADLAHYLGVTTNVTAVQFNEAMMNRVVAISNQKDGSPVQLAIALGLYLELLKAEYGKGTFEQGVQNAVPALRAVEDMLAAA
jgi:hypothetical protein